MRVLNKVARRNGVSLDTVINEIELAIAAGMSSTDPTAQIFWRSVPCAGERPTAAELVEYIASLEQLQNLSSATNAGIAPRLCGAC